MRISDWSSDVCSSDLLRRVSEYAAFAIDLERTHFPAVPERDACFHSFVGHVVSDILVRQSISSIGLGFLVKGRRDNIPPRSTFAEMVEGREGSSDVIRVVKGGEGWCSLWRPIRDAQSRPP